MRLGLVALMLWAGMGTAQAGAPRFCGLDLPRNLTWVQSSRGGYWLDMNAVIEAYLCR